MQHSMFNPSDVHVDWHPSSSSIFIKCSKLKIKVVQKCMQTHACWLCGSKKRRKYQLESTNVSMVSHSRLASSPHLGHATRFHSSIDSSGFPSTPEIGTPLTGSKTGSCDSGIGTARADPSFWRHVELEQYTTGIGAPQYRCLDTDQSFKRYYTHDSKTKMKANGPRFFHGQCQHRCILA